MARSRNDEHQKDQVVLYRFATKHDARDIGELHADSWRRNYRGAYLDSYLDGDIAGDRLQVWESRLSLPQVDYCTVVAVGGREVLGFVHLVFDSDPKWGALVDNLHVRNDFKKNGIGTRLLSEAALGLLERRPPGPIHLWVLEQNKAAQSFYQALGAVRVETEIRGPFPGGGSTLGHRYFWPDASVLVVRDAQTPHVAARKPN